MYVDVDSFQVECLMYLCMKSLAAVHGCRQLTACYVDILCITGIVN